MKPPLNSFLAFAITLNKNEEEVVIIFNEIRKQAHFINFGVIIKTKQINIEDVAEVKDYGHYVLHNPDLKTAQY